MNSLKQLYVCIVNRTNFVVNLDANEDDDASRQTQAVLFVCLVGLAVGIVINFANLHTDFQDLHDFYRGYMGRRLLISEGKLSSREYLEALELVHKQMVNEKKVIILPSPL